MQNKSKKKRVFSFQNRKNSSWLLLIAACMLTLPALFINLGVMPFTSDEPTRGIVTLEMIYSGNYITPTFTGEYYYNKPPLYNWILAPLFIANGSSASEWLVRLPAALALLGFCITIFLFTRRYFGNENGIIAALMFLTCGRILFWDSMLGLIDILYSWVTFTSFVVIINNILEKNYIRLFLLSYLLAAAGFMLKGMPSLVFQGISLLVVFISMKQFRKLFSRYHFIGIGLFLLITGGYLFLYSLENSLEQYLAILWDQSSQRTAVRKGFSDTIRHLLLFHPEMIYHFLPWSLMVVLLLFKRSRTTLLSGPYIGQSDEAIAANHIPRAAIRLMVLLFIANIIVYWLSPATIPRYVLMLAPLTFIPLLIISLDDKIRNTRLHKSLEVIFYFITPAILLIATASLPFIRELQDISHIALISITFSLIILTILIAIIKYKQLRLPLFIILLLLLRIVFNLTWIPVKAEQVYEHKQKTEALEIVKIAQGKPLKIIGKTWVDHVTVIYITSERKETLGREFKKYPAGTFFLTDEVRLHGLQRGFPVPYHIHTTTSIKHNNNVICLITFEEDFEIP